MEIRSHSLSAVIAAIAACTPAASELPPLARMGVGAALEGWKQAGLPTPDKERCDFSGTRLRWAPLRGNCPSPAASDAQHYACLAWEESANLFRPTKYPVIVVRPDVYLLPNSEPVIHEMMHALTHCSGLPWWTPANTQHLEPRIWSAAELVPGTSAQSRARALME